MRNLHDAPGRLTLDLSDLETTSFETSPSAALAVPVTAIAYTAYCWITGETVCGPTRLEAAE